MIKSMTRGWFWGILLSLLGAAGALGAPAPEELLAKEVRRLAREVPPGGGEGSGMVWQRRSEYELQADGSLVRRSRWIVELPSRGAEAWRLWDIPVPVGGKAELLASGLYDAQTGRPLAPLSVENDDEGGIASLRVRAPRHDGAVVALEYLQVFPRRMNVDDVVWLALDLPQWEQVITVRVPQGSAFFWKGVEAPAPEVTDEGPWESYEWRVVNRPAWPGMGLLSQGRPVLTFSLRKGPREALTPLDYLESLPLPEPKGAFARALRGANRIAAGKRLLGLMNGSSTLLEGAPWDAVRPGELISPEGPWTSWERVLLLRRWLEKVGWKATLWWIPVLDLGDDAPATARAWLRPVLELKPSGGGEFFWDVGQNVAPGEVPSALWGATILRREGARVERRSMGKGALETHRFSVEWTLSLDQEGVARGSVDVTLRGGWVGIFAPQGVPEADAVKSQIRWPSGAGRPVLGEATRTVYPYGYRFSFPVTVPLGIPGPGRVLVRFPGVDLPWTADLRCAAAPCALRFPFVFEQRFSLALPKGYRVLDLPKGGERGRRVVLKETVRYREKYHEVVGESRLLVKDVRLGDPELAELESALAAEARWGGHQIPLMKK